MSGIELSLPLLLIASVAIVSLAAWASDSLKSAFILHPYSVRHNRQLHRLLTAGWLHADTSHLVFNMLTLWFFAGEVTRTLGDVKFLVLYVSAVVVAHVPTTLRYMNRKEYRSLGASGAVAAVMFSAILLRPTMKVGIVFLPFAVPGLVYAVLYLVYSAVQSFRGRGLVNHDAHFTGAVYGALLTWVFAPARVEAALRHLF